MRDPEEPASMTMPYCLLEAHVVYTGRGTILARSPPSFAQFQRLADSVGAKTEIRKRNLLFASFATQRNGDALCDAEREQPGRPVHAQRGSARLLCQTTANRSVSPSFHRATPR